MPAVVVRYRTKPDRTEENQQLVEKVFAELDEMHATGFGYASFRLDDGVSWLHVIVEDEGGGSVSLADVPAFREFQAGIADRCAEQPVAMAATVVGTHRIFGGERLTGGSPTSLRRPCRRTWPLWRRDTRDGDFRSAVGAAVWGRHVRKPQR